jgi:hypothetical protein
MGLNKRCSICGDLLSDSESSFLDQFFDEEELEYSHENCLFKDKYGNDLTDLDCIREEYEIDEYRNLFCEICENVLTSFDEIDVGFSEGTNEFVFYHEDCLHTEDLKYQLINNLGDLYPETHKKTRGDEFYNTTKRLRVINEDRDASKTRFPGG